MQFGKDKIFLANYPYFEVSQFQALASRELMETMIFPFPDHKIHLDQRFLVNRIEAALVFPALWLPRGIDVGLS